MPDRSFTFEIEEHFGTISSREGWNKELNLVKWNGAAAKYDIREWDQHHEQMRRGLTLTPWEMRKMVELFVSRNNEAAVARGRAIESERNARRLAARQKVEVENAAPSAAVQTEPQADQSGFADLEEQQAQEGAVPLLVESQSHDDEADVSQEEKQDADF